jgi:hypothetical protein
MRVLVGPRTDLGRDGIAAVVVQALAGPEGVVVSLKQAGVARLSRPQTQAEVSRLREALRGGVSGVGGSAEAPGALVGYVCRGTSLGEAATRQGGGEGARPLRVVAVTDHANLTWRSPLTGPNDDRVGPRFPSMTGIYAAEAVVERLGTTGGIIVTPGMVAGVRDDGALAAYEAETAEACGFAAVSSELVSVAIVAAHMGLRVAAAVLTMGESQEEETGSGRS